MLPLMFEPGGSTLGGGGELLGSTGGAFHSSEMLARRWYCGRKVLMRARAWCSWEVQKPFVAPEPVRRWSLARA